MQTPIDLPHWLPAASRLIQRLGFRRALSYMCLSVWFVSIVMSQLIITMMGDGNRWVAAVSTSFCALSITGVVGGLMLKVLICLNEAHRSMSRYASLDALTGHFNRRHFLDLADKIWAGGQRYERGCSVLLIELDHWGRITDLHGHLCLDHVLQELARGCAAALREADLFARHGEHRFIALLQQTDPLGALDAADRIREGVSQMHVQWHGREVPITVSIGVASSNPQHKNLQALVQEGEEALYAAQTAGRNCVRTSTDWRHHQQQA